MFWNRKFNSISNGLVFATPFFGDSWQLLEILVSIQ